MEDRWRDWLLVPDSDVILLVILPDFVLGPLLILRQLLVKVLFKGHQLDVVPVLYFQALPDDVGIKAVIPLVTCSSILLTALVLLGVEICVLLILRVHASSFLCINLLPQGCFGMLLGSLLLLIVLFEVFFAFVAFAVFAVLALSIIRLAAGVHIFVHCTLAVALFLQVLGLGVAHDFPWPSPKKVNTFARDIGTYRNSPDH